MSESVRILWRDGTAPAGRIVAERGTLEEVEIDGGKGTVEGAAFRFHVGSGGALRVRVSEARIAPGPDATRIAVQQPTLGFSFWLRDAVAGTPLYLPDHGAIVTRGGDDRTYEAIAEDLGRRGLRGQLQQIAEADEETWEAAAAHVRELTGPAWLGLSRDIRIFEVDYNHNYHDHAIRPRFHGPRVRIGETELAYMFIAGRGTYGVWDLHRRLEDGALPILHAVRRDGDVAYHCTSFAVPETSPLTAAALRGTDFLVADGHAFGHMFTPEQQAAFDARLETEMNQPEETVLFTRVEARNNGAVPRYAFFLNPRPNVPWIHDRDKGFCELKDGGVLVVSQMDGRPLPQPEMAVLVQPGQSVAFEFRIPHRPIPRDRAEALARQDFDARYRECRAFWKAKLASGASFDLPEPRMDEMAKAGLLHLDLVAYGREPEGPITATIGHYCPIGSESSPIIQFLDSMGWHTVARRAIHYFLEKQHADGFIQNFGGYMLETGAALWTMGEHYRYTRDDEWVRSIHDKLLLSCNYILAWRSRNLREDLRGKGYGMCEGKVADPEDPFRQYTLNGYAYLGLARVAEMLRQVDPAQSERLAAEAAAFREDIRTALFESLARCPVAPVGDGRWLPAPAAWAEGDSAPWMLTESDANFTHGAFALREALLGAVYLIFQEVIDPAEPAAGWLNDLVCELFTERNVGPSQPFYGRHPWVNLQRGEVKAFLKAWYNAPAGLADRETYSFWEHYFHASPHKTHEEAWFLMQTRWMLYHERDETLKLWPGIPRRWLEPGKRVGINNAASYFGPLTASVEASADGKRLTARVVCEGDYRPKRVVIRLPHPARRAPVTVGAGVYDAEQETVTLMAFEGRAEVVLTY